MSLIQALPDGPLDIVGDIHGEIDALNSLIKHLGYDGDGAHPDGRSLVFVGDFCDRGPDSPAVLALVQALVESKERLPYWATMKSTCCVKMPRKALAGFFTRAGRRTMSSSHTKRSAMKPGYASLRFWLRYPSDLSEKTFGSFTPHGRPSRLPLSERCRLARSARATRNGRAPQGVMRSKLRLTNARQFNWEWGHDLHDRHKVPPFMPAVAERDVNMQMMNPLKVLTSGVERAAKAPFFSGDKWRFTERVQWWDEYGDAVPAVIGHYWRRVNRANPEKAGKRGPYMFVNVKPTAWHGKHNNVFCVDFSVGARYEERKTKPTGACYFKLAALRWPELTLMFDDEKGHEHAVTTHGPASF